MSCPGHIWGGVVLPLCLDAVSLFYRPPRELGREKEILTPLAFQWIVKFW